MDKQFQYPQDELLEAYFVYWYNKVANVSYDFGIVEEEITKFRDIHNSISEKELVKLHSRYKIWRKKYYNMEPAICLELYYGYVNRMDNKERLLGNEIIQRFILEDISPKVFKNHKKQWYKRNETYIGALFFLILYIIFYAFVMKQIMNS